MFTIGRLALDDPESWAEQLGDPIANAGGAAVPAARQGSRSSGAHSTISPNTSADALADRLRIRRQLRSLANNTPYKDRGLYIAWDADSEQNGWYVPDTAQLAAGADAALATGYFRLEGVSWFLQGRPRTHRRALAVAMKDRRAATQWRDYLKQVYSTDFAGLTPLALTYLPAGTSDAVLAATGAPVAASALATATPEGGTLYVVQALSDLAVVSFEQPAAQRNWGDVVALDRRGTLGYGYTVTNIGTAPSAYWRVAELTGTSAADSSGNGRVGTYAGGFTLNQVGATGDASPSVLFDGATGRITTAYNPFAAGSQLTFAGWANRRVSTAVHTLLGSDGATANFLLRAKSGSNDVEFFSTTSAASVSWAGALPGTGQWFHWALTYNDATKVAELFVNGASKGAQTLAANISPGSAGNVEIGSYRGTLQTWDGNQEDIAAWTSILTAAQVATLYLAGVQGVDPQAAFGWEEVYGSDYPLTAGDVPVLANGRCRVRYDSTNTPGFRIDVWTGTAWVEQGKMVFFRRGDTLGYLDTLLSTSLVEYSQDRVVIAVVMQRSADAASSRERIFITLQRGWSGPRFEIYPAPKANGSAAGANLIYALATADANNSALKIDAADAAATLATAGSGSALWTGGTSGAVGASTFTGENTLAALRPSTGYSVVMTSLQAAATAFVNNDTAAYGGSARNQMQFFLDAAGYLSAQLGFTVQRSDQNLEAESMTLGATASAQADAAASGGNTVKETQTAETNATVDRTSNLIAGAKYRVFARVKVDAGATGSFITRSGTNSGSKGVVTTTSTTYVWLDLGVLTISTSSPGALRVNGWRSAGASGAVYVDRIETLKLEDRGTTAPRYDGARDQGQAALYDSRAFASVVTR